jgi:hypothetical protein
MQAIIRPSMLALFALGLLAASTAQATFIPIEESAIYNPTTGDVDFRLRFNRAPDFFTFDEYGRRATFFQYEIRGDLSQAYPYNYDSIIRGPEMTASGIPIRLARPSAPHPPSGGWGAIVAWSDYVLDGDLLTFSAPLDVLSQHTQDGQYTYYLLTGEYGGADYYALSEISGAAIPEPSTLALFGTAMGALAYVRRRQKPKA